jgi:hypothetical protein
MFLTRTVNRRLSESTGLGLQILKSSFKNTIYLNANLSYKIIVPLVLIVPYISKVFRVGTLRTNGIEEARTFNKKLCDILKPF